MTPEKETLLLIRGTIAELPAADQEAVQQAAAQIEAVIQQNPRAGCLAVVVLAAAMAAAEA